MWPGTRPPLTRSTRCSATPKRIARACARSWCGLTGR